MFGVEILIALVSLALFSIVFISSFSFSKRHAGMPPPKRSPIQRKLRVFRITIFLSLLLIFTADGAFASNAFLNGQQPPAMEPPVQSSCKNLPTVPGNNQGIGITQSPDPKTSPPGSIIEYVGISEGRFIFDQADPTVKELKCQGALQLINKDYNAAEAFWTEAAQPVQTLDATHSTQVLQRSPLTQGGSRDAEALIYRENQYVLDTCYGACQYFNIIVGTILTGDDVEYGRNVLQGAYVAQENFNRTQEKSDPTQSTLRMRLLIANFGSQVKNLDVNGSGTLSANDTISQIIKAVQEDPKHTKGVVLSLPFVPSIVMQQLNQSAIPVVLSGSFSELQIQSITNVFPVAASVEREGQVGARYVEEQGYRKVALFFDPDNPYSSHLANAFRSQFTADSQNKITNEEQYKTSDEMENGDETNSITRGVQDILNNDASPDILYFAGDTIGANMVLKKLDNMHNTTLRIIGGDTLYELGLNAYDPGNYKRLVFTTFAFPDEWYRTGKNPPVLTSYRLLFSGWPPDRIYGYRRPDSDVLLAYDALSVFLIGCEKAYEKNNNFSSADLRDALISIQGQEAFQGFSGRISFGNDFRQKAVIVLYVGDDGYTQPGPVYGCLDMTAKEDPQCAL